MEESVLRPACVAPSARLPTLARKTHSPAAGSAAGSRPDARVVSRGTRVNQGARGFKTGASGLGSGVGGRRPTILYVEEDIQYREGIWTFGNAFGDATSVCAELSDEC